MHSQLQAVAKYTLYSSTCKMISLIVSIHLDLFLLIASLPVAVILAWRQRQSRRVRRAAYYVTYGYEELLVKVQISKLNISKRSRVTKVHLVGY